TTDDRFLIISGAESTSGNRLFYIDLQSDSQAIVTLRDTTQGDTYLIDSQDATLLLYTNLDAPNGKVVSYNTQTEQWADVIAE
ncbi:S9 family peptidase, partial [Vibrio sp. Vb2880]|nr:S9 family peptidase [Vibrio sp. Vb2880]